MAFVVGQVVRPRRRFAGRSSAYTTSATGRRTYDADELVDVYGYRTMFGRIVENLGTATYVYTFFDRSGGNLTYGRALAWNPVAWAPSTAYVVDNVRSANGQLWLCTVSGTSAGVGTGPSGSGTVVDGGVTWVELIAPDTDETLSAVQTGTIYSVDVQLIGGGVVRAYYPEGELVAATNYADYLASGAAYPDPTNVLPLVSATHADLASPPQAVADLARAYEVAGVDPRA